MEKNRYNESTNKGYIEYLDYCRALGGREGGSDRDREVRPRIRDRRVTLRFPLCGVNRRETL